MSWTIKDHARNALTLAQYIPANVSGVAFSFSQWMQLAIDLDLDQKQRNSHPITQGYLIGLYSMFHLDDENYANTIEGLKSLIDSKEVSGP